MDFFFYYSDKLGLVLQASNLSYNGSLVYPSIKKMQITLILIKLSQDHYLFLFPKLSTNYKLQQMT